MRFGVDLPAKGSVFVSNRRISQASASQYPSLDPCKPVRRQLGFRFVLPQRRMFYVRYDFEHAVYFISRAPIKLLASSRVGEAPAELAFHIGALEGTQHLFGG